MFCLISLPPRGVGLILYIVDYQHYTFLIYGTPVENIMNIFLFVVRFKNYFATFFFFFNTFP